MFAVFSLPEFLMLTRKSGTFQSYFHTSCCHTVKEEAEQMGTLLLRSWKPQDRKNADDLPSTFAYFRVVISLLIRVARDSLWVCH